MDAEIKTSVQDLTLTIDIDGRLDAIAVKELERVFETQILENKDIDEVLLNFEKVPYISSAGLRFLLSRYNLMTHKGGSLMVIKPCESVMDIFNITGFSQLLPIDNGKPHPFPKENHELYPLRPIQRMLIDDNFNSIKSVMMNMGGLVRLDPSVDLEKLKEAINIVIHEHDIFQCRFSIDEESGDIMQRFDGDVEDIEITDLTDAELQEYLAVLDKPFDIVGGCLWRIGILRSETKNYFYVYFYHAIMDGVGCVMIFCREVDRYYKALLQGTAPDDIRHSHSSYAEYIREELAAAAQDNDEEKEYWDKMLEGFSEEYFPPRDINEAPRDNEIEVMLEGLHKDYFNDLPYHDGCFFMGATLLFMAIVTGKKQAIMTWIHNGRTNGKERRLMGLMLEQLPIRWEFCEDLSVTEYVRAIDELMKEGVQKRKGLRRIYEEELRPDTPAFIFQKGAIGRRGEIQLGDAICEIEALPEDDEKNVCDSAMDIELNAYEDGRYSVVFDYDAGRYSDKAVEHMAGIMKTVVEKMQKGCSLFEILES